MLCGVDGSFEFPFFEILERKNPQVKGFFTEKL